MSCALSENSDQPAHTCSLIRIFTVRSKDSQGPKVSSSGQRRLADDQADLSLRWAHGSLCRFCRAAAQLKSIP